MKIQISKPLRFALVLSVLAVAGLFAGCEDQNKKCDSKCPVCSRKCDFPKEWDKHKHPEFDKVFGKGTKLHKCGDNPGDHAWDKSGTAVGQFYKR